MYNFENTDKGDSFSPFITKTIPILRIVFILIILCFTPLNSFSKDFFITFVKEQYNEAKTEGKEKIYHTWFVRSDAGNKLLVLTGEDVTQRNWLRDYKKKYDLFLIKVPDAETGEFEISTVFNLDINNLHPVDRAVLEEEKQDKKNTGKKKKKKKKKKK